MPEATQFNMQFIMTLASFIAIYAKSITFRRAVYYQLIHDLIPFTTSS